MICCWAECSFQLDHICHTGDLHKAPPMRYGTAIVQAVMGTLVKRHLAAQWGLQPEQIYHCAVMPCYDKKLEASREDFNVPGASREKPTIVILSLCYYPQYKFCCQRCYWQSWRQVIRSGIERIHRDQYICVTACIAGVVS